FAFKVRGLASLTLDLATRGLGQSARLNEHDLVRLQLVSFRYGLPDGSYEAFGFQCSMLPFDFLNDNETFFMPGIDRKRSAIAGLAQRRMTLFRRTLDVLRIMILSANDNEILQAPRHVQVVAFHKAQIACAQKRAFLCIGNPRFKR